MLAETDYAELEIAMNYVIFGEDIDIVTYNDSVEAFLVKEKDSPPVYPNGITSSNEIPQIVETLLESSSSSEDILSTLICSSSNLFQPSFEMPPASKRIECIIPKYKVRVTYSSSFFTDCTN